MLNMDEPNLNSMLDRTRKRKMPNQNLGKKSAAQVKKEATVHVKKEPTFPVKTESTTQVEEESSIEVKKDPTNQIEKVLGSSLTTNRDGNFETLAPSPKVLGMQIGRLRDLYDPDPSRKTRRAALIADHDTKTKRSADWRDQAMGAIRAKHLAYVEELDNELAKILAQLDKESKAQQTNKLELDMTLSDSNMTTQRRGGQDYSPPYCATKAFEESRKPKDAKQYKEPETPDPVDVNIGNAYVPTRSLISFRLPPSKAPRNMSDELELPSSRPATTAITVLTHSLSITPIFTSINIEPSCQLKRKHEESHSQHNKRLRPETTTAIFDSSGVEKEALRPKLIENAFCFISAWHVDLKEENVELMRQMLERFYFYPEAIRADTTGYFFIFESTERGDRLAEACWNKFKTWKFRKQHMYMKLFPRGTAMMGYD